LASNFVRRSCSARGILAAVFQPIAQGIVHARLPALAGGFEGGQHVVIEADGDSFFVRSGG
jgi:hypothetical protein